MHHKFVIIDDRLVALGSFNWTSQAVTCNNESLVVTNDSQIVAPFSKEFDKLWHQMEPTKWEKKICLCGNKKRKKNYTAFDTMFFVCWEFDCFFRFFFQWIQTDGTIAECVGRGWIASVIQIERKKREPSTVKNIWNWHKRKNYIIFVDFLCKIMKWIFWG